MKFEVLILGCSSATPMYGRHPTAQLINIHEQLVLVDCGEGTQMRLSKYGIKHNRIQAVFISHLHGDHYLGLMGLMSSMHLMGRTTPLRIFGPPGLREMMEMQFRYSQTELRYPLSFQVTATDTEQLIWSEAGFSVYSFPLDHRIPCTGFRFEEQPRLPSLRVEKVTQLGIPKAFYKLLKQGVDYTAADGQVYSWEELTQPAPIPRKYAFCSDTADTGRYLSEIQGVDLLYHEATFMHDMLDRAVETYHTTALQAGQVAVRSGVKKLLIGHYSARYKDLNPLLEEARTVFGKTELALEGQWYQV